jgi:hypothetical protein
MYAVAKNEKAISKIEYDPRDLAKGGRPKSLGTYSKFSLLHKIMLIYERPDLTNEDCFLKNSTIVDGNLEY